MTVQKFFGIGAGTVAAVGLLTALPLSAAETVSESASTTQNSIAQGAAPAAACVALQEVTTGETEIRKRIENRLIAQGNWNTDFLVPSGQEFTYYVAIITPENDDAYEMIANMRFSDGSSEQAFSRRADLTNGETYAIPFQSSTFTPAAVINLRVGGTNGNFYTISAAACP
ncbi:MAG: hypothetical protein ACFCVD_23255 [Nodosilinea sp.]